MPEATVVVAVALVRQDRRWLVAKRVPDAHLGNYWEFPGGKRHADESLHAAAIRELFEECRVRARAVETVAVVRHVYPDRTIELHAVLCEWISGEGEPVECSECRWLELEALRRIDFPPANEPVLAALERHVSRESWGA